MNKYESWLSLLDSDKFSELFIEELGWSQPSAKKISIDFGATSYEIVPVAGYKGIHVWSCAGVPNARVQREIDKYISRVSAERLIIFFDEVHQHWQWPMSKESSGKGIIRLVKHEHIKGRNTLSILQRLDSISIPLGQEPPTLVNMLLKLRKAFDADKVTKKFYKEYSVHQKKIVAQLEGLEKVSDKEWYSSLLLNRIMFIYFMQWKGFMDDNQNYLSDRLEKLNKLQGPNHFYGFFRDFLLPLFHKGLGAGEKILMPPEISILIGNIPYINGGIFSENELELAHDINLPDEAFREVFEFFDTYQWHLDSRTTGNPNEINPDILGYVFEQFVNNKAQGAYYTKEDVTEYMTSNSLLIYVLQKIEKDCDINLFKALSLNTERYIWSSLKHGEAEYIKNNDENESFLLPGETTYEFNSRMMTLIDLRSKLANGQIASISELISLNIDLELLVNDIIDSLDTVGDVIKIWKILTDVKIVDPTCGSGAFLFAALNQLESLYSSLLDVGEIHYRTSKSQELKELFEVVNAHPNRRYFVLKHASQNNLYGVDIMREATEIARLRLFLKLISAIDSYDQIEPLPDLEFNIKSGNLLVGIPKSNSLDKYMSTLDSVTFIEDINNQVNHLADLWENFQISQNLGHEKSINAKKILANFTHILRVALDKLFYEAVVSNKDKKTFDLWKEEASPFHWFVEFPDVFQNDGFDVVIGNPPYIKKSKVNYDISGHNTSECPDIYAMCMERASLIANSQATFAMIVMSNIVFSNKYSSLRKFLKSRFEGIWISGFAKRPSSLFTGVQVRNAILIGSQGISDSVYSAPMRRWTKEYRPHLMGTIKYTEIVPEWGRDTWQFISSQKIADILNSKTETFKDMVLFKGPNFTLDDGVPVWDKSSGKMAPLFFISNAYNWISAFKQVPPSVDGKGNSVTTTALNWIWFNDEDSRDIAFTLFVSKWMFAWWTMNGDDFNVTRDILLSFPVDFKRIPSRHREKLIELARQLDVSMPTKVKYQRVTFRDGRVINVGNWDLSTCRETLSEIDDMWTEILNATESKGELLLQYYTTVKTVTESIDSADEFNEI